jgi:hypothetical protein
MENLNQVDRDIINGNLNTLDELLSQYKPNTTEKVTAYAFLIFVGIASVAISMLFSEILAVIAVCVFVSPFLFGNKANDSSSSENIELASEAFMIVQRCVRIFNYPEGTIRHVGYTRIYDEHIYNEFIKHFPRYKNSYLKQLIKHCK